MPNSGAARQESLELMQGEVKTWGQISSRWPVFSTCCCRICSHIKGHAVFTEKITELYNKERSSLLHLSRYCDPLICVHLFFDLHWGGLSFYFETDPLSQYYSYIPVSENTWFLMPLICLMTCIGANQSTNQNPVCWGKVLCMTHPTTRLSDFSRFLYNCAKGRLQSWHWRGNYCVILGSTGSLTCLLYMTHWEWEPSVPSHERQPLARSSYFNVSPCFPTPMKTCFKSECWLSYLSKSSYFTVDSRSYLVKHFFLVGTKPEVDISLRINRLLLCNGSWEWSRCNESNGKCWFISVN